MERLSKVIRNLSQDRQFLICDLNLESSVYIEKVLTTYHNAWSGGCMSPLVTGL